MAVVTLTEQEINLIKSEFSKVLSDPLKITDQVARFLEQKLALSQSQELQIQLKEAQTKIAALEAANKPAQEV